MCVNIKGKTNIYQADDKRAFIFSTYLYLECFFIFILHGCVLFCVFICSNSGPFAQDRLSSVIFFAGLKIALRPVPDRRLK